MMVAIRDQTAIVGIGQSEYGRHASASQLKLGATALKAALEDAGLEREDVDGIVVHMGWPLGVDYDRIAESYGLDVRWASQFWLHGRFVTSAIQHAAMAIACGLASVVACVTAISFTRERQILEEMAQGKSNAAIAQSLFITERSVEKVIHGVFLKLGLTWQPDINRRVKAVLVYLSEEGARPETPRSL